MGNAFFYAMARNLIDGGQGGNGVLRFRMLWSRRIRIFAVRHSL